MFFIFNLVCITVFAYPVLFKQMKMKGLLNLLKPEASLPKQLNNCYHLINQDTMMRCVQTMHDGLCEDCPSCVRLRCHPMHCTIPGTSLYSSWHHCGESAAPRHHPQHIPWSAHKWCHCGVVQVLVSAGMAGQMLRLARRVDAWLSYSQAAVHPTSTN